MIAFHFWSIQSITITQKTVIDCNRLRLMITPCLVLVVIRFNITFLPLRLCCKRLLLGR